MRQLNGLHLMLDGIHGGDRRRLSLVYSATIENIWPLAAVGILNAKPHVCWDALWRAPWRGALAVWGGLSRHPGCLGEIMGKARPRDRFGDRCPTPFGAGTEQPCRSWIIDWLAEQYSDATKYQQPMQPMTVDLLEMCRDTP